jgi:hypothetical protein
MLSKAQRDFDPNSHKNKISNSWFLCVTKQIVTNPSESRMLPSSGLKFLEDIDPETGGTDLLRNVGEYFPVDSVQHDTRHFCEDFKFQRL